MNVDELLDGTKVPWDAISGSKPPSPVSAHQLPPQVFRNPVTDPVAVAAREANLRVLQRALQTSSRWVGMFTKRQDNDGSEAA